VVGVVVGHENDVEPTHVLWKHGRRKLVDQRAEGGVVEPRIGEEAQTTDAEKMSGVTDVDDGGARHPLGAGTLERIERICVP